jgi:hypothetical protein
MHDGASGDSGSTAFEVDNESITEHLAPKIKFWTNDPYEKHESVLLPKVTRIKGYLVKYPKIDIFIAFERFVLWVDELPYVPVLYS